MGLTSSGTHPIIETTSSMADSPQLVSKLNLRWD